MLRLIKTNCAFLVINTLMAAMALNACGEKTVTIPNSLVHSFDHKLPESFEENRDLLSDEIQPFMDSDIVFVGNALGDPNANTFDIGLQFETKTQGRRIFVESLVLDAPNLKEERVMNEFVDIDVLDKPTQIYFKRILPFDNISGYSIPLTADFFTLRIDYKLDDSPTKQMSIKFENTSFWAPNF